MKKFLTAILLICIGVSTASARTVCKNKTCKFFIDTSSKLSKHADISRFVDIVEDVCLSATTDENAYRCSNAMGFFVEKYDVTDGISYEVLLDFCDLSFGCDIDPAKKYYENPDLAKKQCETEKKTKCKKMFNDLLAFGKGADGKREVGGNCKADGVIGRLGSEGKYVATADGLKCKLKKCGPTFVVAEDGFSCVSSVAHKDLHNLSQEEQEVRYNRVYSFTNVGSLSDKLMESPYLYQKYDGYYKQYMEDFYKEADEYISGFSDKDPTNMVFVKKMDKDLYESLCGERANYLVSGGFHLEGERLVRNKGSYIKCENKAADEKYMFDGCLSCGTGKFCAQEQFGNETVYICAVDQDSHLLTGEDKLVYEALQTTVKENHRLTNDPCDGLNENVMQTLCERYNNTLKNAPARRGDVYSLESRARGECYRKYGYELNLGGCRKKK